MLNISASSCPLTVSVLHSIVDSSKVILCCNYLQMKITSFIHHGKSPTACVPVPRKPRQTRLTDKYPYDRFMLSIILEL